MYKLYKKNNVAENRLNTIRKLMNPNKRGNSHYIPVLYGKMNTLHSL